MPDPPLKDRDRADACPGALRVHQAADGGLARVRIPGGVLTAAHWAALAAAAARHGTGGWELTSRGNVQLRGIGTAATSALAGDLAAAGLLPSETHETVRNIVASPLTGRCPGGVLDLRGYAAALDTALCADPALAALPGRFLFALDDGRGDVATLTADVTGLALHPDRAALLLAGRDLGLRLHPSDLVAGMLAAARAFCTERHAQGSAAWRLTELRDGPTRVAAALRADRAAPRLLPAAPPHRPPGPAATPDPADSPVTARRPAVALEPGAASGTTRGPAVAQEAGAAAGAGTGDGLGAARGSGTEAGPGMPDRFVAGGLPVGVLPQVDGRFAVSVLAPLGRLDAAQLALLGDLAPGDLVVTPWRGVLLPDVGPAAAADVLQRAAEAGLVTDPASPWAGMSACAGRPGCAKSLADVRTDAAATATATAARAAAVTAYTTATAAAVGRADLSAVGGMSAGADTRTGAAERPGRAAPATAGPVRGGMLSVHWVGCERQCGQPSTDTVQLRATPSGYLIVVPGRPPEPAGPDLAAAVRAARAARAGACPAVGQGPGTSSRGNSSGE